MSYHSQGERTEFKIRVFHIVEKTPSQGRLEGCRRILAATHLICGLESVL